MFVENYVYSSGNYVYTHSHLTGDFKEGITETRNGCTFQEQ